MLPNVQNIPLKACAGLCLALVSLSGCATLPISGPTSGRIQQQEKSDKNDIGFRIEEITPQIVADLDAVPTAQAIALSSLASGWVPQRTDVIRRGDTLTISIFEVGFALFGGLTALDTKIENMPGNAQRVGIRVDDDGSVSLPYIGNLAVAGLTPDQVQGRIEARLRGLSQSPQALVAIADSVENSVYISGSIARSGRYRLSAGREQLLDLIALAGGPNVEIDNVELHIVRTGRVATARLSGLHTEDADNIILAPGDRIELVNKPRSFTVFGASDRISQMPFGIGTVTLADAIARAGGPADTRANPKGVFLFRYVKKQDNTEEPVIYRLNMMNAQNYFLAQRVVMRDKDLIYFSNASANLPTKLVSIINQLVSPAVTAKVLTQ